MIDTNVNVQQFFAKQSQFPCRAAADFLQSKANFPAAPPPTFCKAKPISGLSCGVFAKQSQFGCIKRRNSCESASFLIVGPASRDISARTAQVADSVEES
jgi:hypothetical protein